MLIPKILFAKRIELLLVLVLVTTRPTTSTTCSYYILLLRTVRVRTRPNRCDSCVCVCKTISRVCVKSFTRAFRIHDQEQLNSFFTILLYRKIFRNESKYSYFDDDKAYL